MRTNAALLILSLLAVPSTVFTETIRPGDTASSIVLRMCLPETLREANPEITDWNKLRPRTYLVNPFTSRVELDKIARDLRKARGLARAYKANTMQYSHERNALLRSLRRARALTEDLQEENASLSWSGVQYFLAFVFGVFICIACVTAAAHYWLRLREGERSLKLLMKENKELRAAINRAAILKQKPRTADAMRLIGDIDPVLMLVHMQAFLGILMDVRDPTVRERIATLCDKIRQEQEKIPS